MTVSNAPSDVIMGATAQVVSAFVSNNAMDVAALPTMLRNVFEVFQGISTGTVTSPQAPKAQPAVPINRSVKDDHIICLEDGLKFQTLKRHLRSRYNMTPEQYRERWGLPADYPMVAPAYARRRSDMAREIGLGRTASGAGRRRRAKPATADGSKE
jgi:predicted transcriptional regulator